jgi:hypothetical protein
MEPEQYPFDGQSRSETQDRVHMPPPHLVSKQQNRPGLHSLSRRQSAPSVLLQPAPRSPRNISHAIQDWRISHLRPGMITAIAAVEGSCSLTQR